MTQPPGDTLLSLSLFGAPPPWVDAVLFDLGGTLVDYLGGAPSWPAMEVPGARALHAHLAAAGLERGSDLFVNRFIAALDARWSAATAGEGHPPTIRGLIDEVCAALDFTPTDELHLGATAAYCATIAAGARAAPGALSVLRWLRGQGVRVGIISNTVWPTAMIYEDLERHGVLPYLEALVLSSECGLWKPDPRIFGLLLGVLGVPAERAVFVGDRLTEDVQGAHGAGLRAILVEDGSGDADRINDTTVMPDAVIHSLEELPAALAALS